MNSYDADDDHEDDVDPYGRPAHWIGGHDHGDGWYQIMDISEDGECTRWIRSTVFVDPRSYC